MHTKGLAPVGGKLPYFGHFRLQESTFYLSKLSVNDISGRSAFKKNDLPVEFANTFSFGCHGFHLYILYNVTFSHISIFICTYCLKRVSNNRFKNLQKY